MILLDANLLIYAINEDAPLHRKAKYWLESVLSGQETVGFSWSVVLAFLRLTTRPGLFRQPLPVETAFDLVASWLAQATATIVHLAGVYKIPASFGASRSCGMLYRYCRV